MSAGRYDVVLATLAREQLLEIEPDTYECLVTGMLADLGSDDARTVGLRYGSAAVKEICGYFITYRALDDAEKKRYEVADGHFVMSRTGVADHYAGAVIDAIRAHAFSTGASDCHFIVRNSVNEYSARAAAACLIDQVIRIAPAAHHRDRLLVAQVR